MNRYLKTLMIVAGLLTSAVVIPVMAETSKTDIVTTDVNAQKININTATAAELQLLNGIGAAKAQAIVEYREANGKFTSLEDLTKVKGIGPKLIEKNAGMLAL
ncbi:ComEA family DNA-binding protein [Shewanella dokdonensis]|uniref:Helix-hairpin-helix domain-containing protein n=1 Tax=Shewanella dokdonensis TaxID=712036 RepID=A0ABX8DDZ2_9GAMM|nr:ComEA family DNA-binding protein [Shewanella dokdonensis]MCL1073308.1 helix-hairpin-helix domain-containing protein [Shewanella dokdonensis]QVK22861.1 helix-hairpin-helix domain-containing protein [Shewanella dokdonensis]